jgi:hypothetical protein
MTYIKVPYQESDTAVALILTHKHIELLRNAEERVTGLDDIFGADCSRW